MRCSSRGTRSPAVRVWLLLGLIVLAGGCRHPAPPAAGPGDPGGEVVAIPEAPLRVLEAAAADLDVSVRLRALETLVAAWPEPGGGPWGPRALHDPSPYVQAAAASALATRRDEPASRDLLRQLALRQGADPYVRGRAAFLLAEVGDTAVLPGISEAWRQAPAGWSAAPLALAAARLGDAEAVGRLDAALRDGVFPLDTGFFELVGRSGLVALVPGLEAAAEQVEEELVLPVAMALMDLGAPSGAAMVRRLLEGAGEEVAMEALDYLAERPSSDAGALVRRARSAGGEGVAAYADLVLVGWGEAPVARAVELVRVEDREIRALALDAVGKALGGPGTPGAGGRAGREAREAVVEALGDEEPGVRLAAVRALARMAGPADLEILEALLDDEGFDLLRVEAARALVLAGP